MHIIFSHSVEILNKQTPQLFANHFMVPIRKACLEKQRRLWSQTLSTHLFKKKIKTNLEAISPFCGATDAPVLDIWMMSALGFKAWVASLTCMLCRLRATDSSD